MGATPVGQNADIALGKLSASIRNHYLHTLFLTKFTAEVIRNKKGEMQAPVSPIANLSSEFNTVIGQDNVTVPVLKQFDGQAYYGQAIVTGKGEKDKWNTTKVYINDVVFPYEGPGDMDQQRAKVLSLLARSRKRLGVRMAQEDEVNAISSFFEGYSRNITNSVALHGLGKSKVYHPNFYVANTGLVDWSGTTQTHANNIGAALDGLSNVSSCRMTVANLEKMRVLVQDIPLDPILIDEKPFYVMLVHPQQMGQLREDPNWKEGVSNGMIRGKNNPLFAAAEAYQSNFLIYERTFSAFGVDWSESGGDYTLTFGATNPVRTRDSYPNKCAIVFGNSALSKGMVGGPRIGEANQNIGGYKELALRQMCGYARNSHYDVHPHVGTPTEGIDQGSAIFVTHSPAPYTI